MGKGSVTIEVEEELVNELSFLSLDKRLSLINELRFRRLFGELIENMNSAGREAAVKMAKETAKGPKYRRIKGMITAKGD